MAAEIAWSWASVREENLPMPPELLAMPVWIIATVAPFWFEFGNAPWQPAQLAA